MRKDIHFVSADEAVKVIRSGDHVHLSSVASAPRILIEAMCRRGEAGELENVKIHHLHTEGQAPYADPKFDGIFFHQGFFIGSNVRKSVQSGYSDYIPVLLSETQKLYRCGALPCDVAMIQVCPPDKHGFVSLGTSVDATLAAIECAKTVIAVVNRYVPRAWGQAIIPMDMIDIFVEDNTPLLPAEFHAPNEIEEAIGRNCAELIEDGACLQMGIGAIPNAVLEQLEGHKDLGIHTEMFADGVLKLVEKGVINGDRKGIDKGKMVSTFVMGSPKCYEFLDDNPMVAMMDVGYTNNPFNIAQNPSAEPEDHSHQLRPPGRSDRTGMRRLARHEILLGGRRPGGFHIRSVTIPGRESYHRHAVMHKKRREQNRPDAPERRGSRDFPRPQGRRPLREIPSGKGETHHQRRTSGPQGNSGQGGFRALRSSLPQLQHLASGTRPD